MAELREFLSTEFLVFFTACMPVVELRGAIPVGVAMGLSPLHSYILSLLGSMLPVPLILFSVRPIFNHLRDTALKGWTDRFVSRALMKSGRIQRYGFWGLLLFVAVPLPGTGVWTGALIASLLDMRFKLAFPAILIGNTMAGALIMLLSHRIG